MLFVNNSDISDQIFVGRVPNYSGEVFYNLYPLYAHKANGTVCVCVPTVDVSVYVC